MSIALVLSFLTLWHKCFYRVHLLSKYAVDEFGLILKGLLIKIGFGLKAVGEVLGRADVIKEEHLK